MKLYENMLRKCSDWIVSSSPTAEALRCARAVEDTLKALTVRPITPLTVYPIRIRVVCSICYCQWGQYKVLKFPLSVFD